MQLSERTKEAVNKYLWLEDEGYYGYFLYKLLIGGVMYNGKLKIIKISGIVQLKVVKKQLLEVIPG